MISFIDFVPEIKVDAKLFRRPDYEGMAPLMARMNEWINATPEIKVINVETVVLPNIHKSSEEGSMDPDLPIQGSATAVWHQFFRVWFEHHSGQF